MTETTLATIRAHSQRQAMDWSLVLVSQGIEATIEHLAEGTGWALLVEPGDYERAVTAIRQYRLENRRWAWRQELEWSGLMFHWGALVWCWVMILFHWLGEALGSGVEGAGVMQSLAVKHGEWWRLFTSVTLHADTGHLAANVSTGLVIFGLAMARYGAGTAILAGLLAGAAGNLAGLLVRSEPYTGLGASGMVMGGLGLLAAQSAFLLRQSRHALRQIMTGLGGGFLLFVLMGLNPASDVIAHLGGFVCGLSFGFGLAFVPQDSGAFKTLNRAAGIVALALAVLTWILALR